MDWLLSATIENRLQTRPSLNRMDNSSELSPTGDYRRGERTRFDHQQALFTQQSFWRLITGVTSSHAEHGWNWATVAHWVTAVIVHCQQVSRGHLVVYAIWYWVIAFAQLHLANSYKYMRFYSPICLAVAIPVQTVTAHTMVCSCVCWSTSHRFGLPLPRSALTLSSCNNSHPVRCLSQPSDTNIVTLYVINIVRMNHMIQHMGKQGKSWQIPEFTFNYTCV